MKKAIGGTRVNDELHNRIKSVKDQLRKAQTTQDPADMAMYERMFWSLMNDNGIQILDVLFDGEES